MVEPSKPVGAKAGDDCFTYLCHSPPPPTKFFQLLALFLPVSHFFHSPMNLMGTGRHSSSSLSSHASSEAGNMVMLGDSSMGEVPEDLYHHMQVPELPQESGPDTVPGGLPSLPAGLVWQQTPLPSSPVTGFRTSTASHTAFLSPHPCRSSQALFPKKGIRLQSWLFLQIPWERLCHIALLPGIPAA